MSILRCFNFSNRNIYGFYFCGFLIFSAFFSVVIFSSSVSKPYINIEIVSSAAGSSQLFFKKEDAYTEEYSIKKNITVGGTYIKYPLLIVGSPLRWDPLNGSALVEVRSSYISIFGMNFLHDEISFKALYQIDSVDVSSDGYIIHTQQNAIDPQLEIKFNAKKVELIRGLLSFWGGACISVVLFFVFFMKVNSRIRLIVVRWLDTHQQLAAFLGSAIIFMILHQFMNVSEFPWDAGDYWKLSAADLLFDFPKDIRGYFYPALLAPAHFMCDAIQVLGFLPYRFISSLAYAYFFAILVPVFYLQLFGGYVSFLRRLIIPLLVAILFPGVIVYTLSDLPALVLMVGASVCALSSASTNIRLKSYSLLVFSGVLAYGAYNTRTIYLFPAGLLLCALVFIVHFKSKISIKLFAVLAFLFGAAAASAPQVIINYKNYQSLSPMVITTSSYKRSLFASQLLWGITLQRYETSIDKDSPGPGVFYMDKAGEQLFSDQKIGTAPFDLPTYIKLVLNNPLPFAGIYGRHIVNGLDLRDGEVYTVGQPRKRDRLALFNFFIIFSGLLVMILAITARRAKTKQFFDSLFWGFLILLPVIAIVPGAIETRFFLALHLAIYCSLAFTFESKSIRILLCKSWPLICVALVISAILFFSISTTTMSVPQYIYSGRYRGEW